MPEKPVIELQNVNFSYTSEYLVLRDINLQVPPNEFASIVGPNGGGKTTLLKLILGLLQAQSGNITVFGKTPTAARKQIGYVPQHISFDPAFPVSVMEVALMGRLSGNRPAWYSKNDKEITLQALEQMQLADMIHRPFNALSGGQRQRVLIARALASQPKLLLLDEPTANVDRQVESLLMEILQSLSKQMAILLVSHDLGVVPQVVKNVICVNRDLYVHPTSALDGNLIREIYGSNISLVRHDHRCCIEEHTHE